MHREQRSNPGPLKHRGSYLFGKKKIQRGGMQSMLRGERRGTVGATNKQQGPTLNQSLQS